MAGGYQPSVTKKAIQSVTLNEAVRFSLRRIRRDLDRPQGVRKISISRREFPNDFLFSERLARKRVGNLSLSTTLHCFSPFSRFFSKLVKELVLFASEKLTLADLGS